MSNRRSFLLALATAPAALWLATPLRAGEPAVYSDADVAIRGADPVAYFTQGEPVIGSPDIGAEWNGARWHFASAENRDAFLKDPEAFAPQYGGYCAWAVSQGYTASTVPEAWAIVDGRLYLNFSSRIQRRWAGDPVGHIASANANWPDVLGG